jgi:lanosterol synthase
MWDVVNPVPPEFWLLPDWVPFAPWRWWIHMRMVYLPMSFIWSKRWTCKETPLIRQLRQELFVQPWESIDWAGNRNSIYEKDNYHPKSWLLRTANWFLVNIHIPYLRTNALVKAAEDFLWMKDEGMLVNGTNGVQCWDTAFLIQSVVDAGLAEDPKWRPMLTKALEFLDDQQMRENVDDQAICYRQQRKGGWAFSNKDQGYAVSDCISEALKAVLLLQRTPGYPKLLDDPGDQRIQGKSCSLC